LYEGAYFHSLSVEPCSPLRHGVKCPFLLRLVKGQYFKILSLQT
jgi:hypothetical protein